jgi:predicted SprT family Zn-dependent metalloprotease
MVTVGWNSRMRTTAGIAIASRREIWLNPALRDISEDEVEKTLLHELAHLLAQHRHGRRRIAPHGAEWRQACIDLGIPDEKRTHQLPFVGRRMKRRYRLRCPGCGHSHERVRRPRGRIACLACCRIHNGGRYDERFRFELSHLTDLDASH